MNDDLSAFESELAQLRPAPLTCQQRQRLHDKIAARLAEPPPRQSFMAAFHWQPWLAWSSAVTAALLLAMASTAIRPYTQLETIENKQVASSNLWDVGIHFFSLPPSSNVRENQFFNSILASNLPQAIIRKI